ncbi:TetR/AcrR family transcriptional regulator [Sphingomonas sp. CGMCC 1.13654]|uniref:TetR/AcrR family transcriptional regulator n=1 Tax=Sphingomonas chungangi TaxID=2683589 RepID=A0A838L5J7_9SPHN|nr:TetR/AcrR family transcriptional regulator [Sphingomonas chungangi]MBA2933729.1 TetR/AcrR family transcriptional regulator [Sphingomonas chungangi]MVW55061.1 TetR family transcriptional regulator [Sphingomonas chungangi]
MTSVGRPREFDREAALADAMRVFWSKGYASTSMNDLCTAMRIRSPSLYAAFGSKEGLYLEALDHYVVTIGNAVWGELEGAKTARAGVEAFLLAATEALPATDGIPAGCMSTLAGLGDEWPDAIARVAREIRSSCLGHLISRLEMAASDGELPAMVDVEQLGRFYFGVFQGMANQARDGASGEDLRGIMETAMTAWPERP